MNLGRMAYQGGAQDNNQFNLGSNGARSPLTLVGDKAMKKGLENVTSEETEVVRQLGRMIAGSTELHNNTKTKNIQPGPIELKPKKTTSSHVRLSESEYKQITQDCQLTGESIPELLKKSYFKRVVIRVLMPRDERDAWFTELRRLGNNLNQLAKRVNSGVMNGWYEEFSIIAKGLASIEKVVVSIYGNSKL